VRLIRGERGLGVPVRLGEAEVIKGRGRPCAEAQRRYHHSLHHGGAERLPSVIMRHQHPAGTAFFHRMQPIVGRPLDRGAPHCR
jgi:hypothetical protein